MNSADQITYIDMIEEMATTPGVAAPSISSASSNFVPKSAIVLKRLEGTGNPPKLGAGSAWTKTVKVAEVTLGDTLPWGRSDHDLRVEMRELEQNTQAELRIVKAQLATIQIAIVGLSAGEAELGVVPSIMASAVAAPTLERLKARIDSDFSSDDWAEVFEFVADNASVGTSAIADGAAAALNSANPRNRAAAARAVAVLRPEHAQLLEAALESEQNPTVRSIMDGALEAARI